MKFSLEKESKNKIEASSLGRKYQRLVPNFSTEQISTSSESDMLFAKTCCSVHVEHLESEINIVFFKSPEKRYIHVDRKSRKSTGQNLYENPSKGFFFAEFGR